MFQTDDVRISKVKELLPPVAVLEKFPATETASSTTFRSREAISKILNGDDVTACWLSLVLVLFTILKQQSNTVSV